MYTCKLRSWRSISWPFLIWQILAILKMTNWGSIWARWASLSGLRRNGLKASTKPLDWAPSFGPLYQALTHWAIHYTALRLDGNRPVGWARNCWANSLGLGLGFLALAALG